MNAYVQVYMWLRPDEERLEGKPRDQARDFAEHIAAAWREAEATDVFDAQAEEELGSEGAHGLLGAIQDSLVLAVSDDAVRRAWVLSTDDVLARLEQLDADGAFEARKAPATKDRPQPGPSDVEFFEKVTDQVIETLVTNATFYTELKPDGRELDEVDSAAVRERLETTAACCRDLDAARELIPAFAADRGDLRPSRALLRSMQQDFLLSLSEDPLRRCEAASAEELTRRLGPVYQGLKADLPSG